MSEHKRFVHDRCKEIHRLDHSNIVRYFINRSIIRCLNSDDIAMIKTVDFFTPIVDEPYMFGQIAAANSLSDVWAMGGEPAVALNIVGFPNCLDPAILGDILAGGADKVKEAGAVLVGGHSVQDDEPKYGLCVSGFVHPDKIFIPYANEGRTPCFYT